MPLVVLPPVSVVLPILFVISFVASGAITTLTWSAFSNISCILTVSSMPTPVLAPFFSIVGVFAIAMQSPSLSYAASSLIKNPSAL